MVCLNVRTIYEGKAHWWPTVMGPQRPARYFIYSVTIYRQLWEITWAEFLKEERDRVW